MSRFRIVRNTRSPENAGKKVLKRYFNRLIIDFFNAGNGFRFAFVVFNHTDNVFVIAIIADAGVVGMPDTFVHKNNIFCRYRNTVGPGYFRMNMVRRGLLFTVE